LTTGGLYERPRSNRDMMPCIHGLSSPGPVVKNWTMTLRILEVIQYKARPAGKVMEIKTNMAGIMKSIILPWAATLGSVEGVMVIFC